MASQWFEEDVLQLVLMARLYQWALAGRRDAWPEFRQWADRFGLSPLGRLRLRWLLPESSPRSESSDVGDATVIRLRGS